MKERVLDFLTNEPCPDGQDYSKADPSKRDGLYPNVCFSTSEVAKALGIATRDARVELEALAIDGVVNAWGASFTGAGTSAHGWSIADKAFDEAYIKAHGRHPCSKVAA